ncbi:MAG: hypothetical protein M3Z26_10875 [Bacteroidota bacterium]|nr:hypothetical protein [Bacteroidota bacterium]
MIKRIIEFLLGVVVTLFLISSYGDKYNPSKPLVAYITTNKALQISIIIVSIVLAFRLIGGKSKDYSKFFYNLFVKLFGDPKRKKL